MNTLKKDWTAETTLAHVLSVIRCLLIVPFPESSLNDEAGKLFMESYDEYSKRALLMADVHGRPHPCVQGDTKESSNEKLDGNDEEPGSGSSAPNSKKSDTSNPLSSKNANKMATKGSGSKSTTGKMKKKKSLRRL